jgi:outer membrane lipoprotein-sorting protein
LSGGGRAIDEAVAAQARAGGVGRHFLCWYEQRSVPVWRTPRWEWISEASHSHRFAARKSTRRAAPGSSSLWNALPLLGSGGALTAQPFQEVPMRWLATMALLGAAACPAAAEENQAEKLYRNLEKKLRAAKTLRVRFDLAVTDARGKEWSLKGSLALGEGDRYRAEARGKLFGEAVEVVEASDGKSVRSVEGKGKARDEEASPRGAGAYFRTALPSRGFLLAHLDLGRRGDAKAAAPSGFELAGKDKVGKREARVVKFRLGPKDEKDGMTAKLWLDAKTDLPLKLALAGGKSDVREVTETYTEFAIGPELDKKLWELPK